MLPDVLHSRATAPASGMGADPRAGDGLAQLRFSTGLTAAAVLLAGRTAAQMPPDVRDSRATAPASGMGADRGSG
ncbi:hypothetical protein [Escherichia coli]|uniref:hypothetical protein n=1 Tax=Escherichia coli TaxID=562 RepID=UPI003989A8F3